MHAVGSRISRQLKNRDRREVPIWKLKWGVSTLGALCKESK